MGSQARSAGGWKPLVGVLGIVYGDIGTSPLYALRECFHGPHAVAPDASAILGVLSLVTWSLILVISLKYMALVLRAHNRGEGGVLALMSLVSGPTSGRGRFTRHTGIVLVGLFGAALLYGDSVITPAISVLSAVEGLEVVAPAFTPVILPATVAILVALFAIQRSGTASVGSFFGPVTIAWFLVIGALGVVSVAHSPEVLAALDPRHAAAFFGEHGWRGFLVLGSVFLVVTGGEALYADMGQFGAGPIRRAWFTLVLPALLLNYFGQGALLIRSPEAAVNPFYLLAPAWAVLPLVLLAAATTVIASQAVITGAFSLTWQAVQLGYLPRLSVRHTSDGEMGQVYLPGINFALLLATVVLVLAFRSSSALAGAYGIAITSTMAITTTLLAIVAVRVWKWNVGLVALLTTGFLAVDLAFFSANAGKVVEGGWFPLLLGGAILIVMTTWSSGRRMLSERIEEVAVPLADLVGDVSSRRLLRAPRVLIFLTRGGSSTPPAMQALAEHLRVVPAKALVITVETLSEPRVPPGRRFELAPAGEGIHRVVVRYGFMESPNIPLVISRLEEKGLRIDPAAAVYVLGRDNVVVERRRGLASWRHLLFAFLVRNAGRPADFYRLPPDRVLEVGNRIVL